MALAPQKAHWQAASQPISRSVDHRPRCHGPYPLTPQSVYRQNRSQGLVQTCTYAGKKGVLPANFSQRYFARQRPCSFFVRFTTLAKIEKRLSEGEPSVNQSRLPEELDYKLEFRIQNR
jgi:transposase